MNLLLWRNYRLRSTSTLAKEQCQNTFSNGCLGSHTDEERSEMRYVMRIAKSVSHQNFERILHFLRGVCLLECLFIPTIPHSLKPERCWMPPTAFLESACRWKHNLITDPIQCNAERTRDDIITRLESNTLSWVDHRLFSIRTSNQSRIPAEFKHITRRRKRN